MVHILGFTPIHFFFHLVNSITSHICGSIYAIRIELTIIYAIEIRSQHHKTLTSLVHYMGISHEKHSKGGLELIQKEMRKKIKKY